MLSVKVVMLIYGCQFQLLIFIAPGFLTGCWSSRQCSPFHSMVNHHDIPIWNVQLSAQKTQFSDAPVWLMGFCIILIGGNIRFGWLLRLCMHRTAASYWGYMYRRCFHGVLSISLGWRAGWGRIPTTTTLNRSYADRSWLLFEAMAHLLLMMFML